MRILTIGMISALGCLVLARAGARGDGALRLPDLTVREGGPAATVFLHGSHAFTLSGFSFGIRHDPALATVTEVTFEGTALEAPGFWNGDIIPRGEVVCAVVLDLSPPLTSFLAPADDHTLARLTLEVKAPAGERVVLDLADGLGDSLPVENVLVDDQGGSHTPTLVDGSILVEPAEVHIPPIADAGSDLLAPDREAFLLDGTGSRSPVGAPIELEWTQLSGPLAEALTRLDVAQPLFALPDLAEDDVLRFQLTVRDGTASSVDTVEVHGIDVDRRRGGVASIEPCSRLAGEGERVLLFQGELAWGTDLEDALWTGIRFTATGDGDESRLLAAVSLHVDANGDGCLDDGDRRLGEPQVLGADDAPVEFGFTERVVSGSPARFFLLGEAAPAAASPALRLLLPGLLFLGGWAALRRGGRRGASAFALLLLPLFFHTSCGGGGGGGGSGGVGGVDRQVRFSLLDPSDLTWSGASTGVAGAVAGPPVHGTAIDIRE